MSKNLVNLTVPSGKVYQVQPLPKHFYLFYGELPQALSEKAVEAVKTGDQEAFERDVEAALTPEQIQKSLIFVREAVKFICVVPKISLTPKDETEISPFEISEEDFQFLSRWAMSGGQSAARLETFRDESGEASANIV